MLDTHKKRVAIIPARGGSTRIPKKNIIDFCGKPMIGWTIEAALESGLFDDVIVSTDCEEIAEVSIKYGASVPFLRKEKADDYSPVSEATIYTLKQLESVGKVYEEVVQLFSVCPLRTSEDIKIFVEYFNNNKLDFLISCFEYVWMNPWWAVSLDNQNRPNRIFKDTVIRSQDLAKLYCPTGAIWVAKVSELLNQGTFYGHDHVFLPINWENAIDIDEEKDIKLAKTLFLMQHEK